MMESVNSNPYYRKAMDSNIGRFGRAVAGNKFISGAFTNTWGVAQGFGVGRHGLLNTSTIGQIQKGQLGAMGILGKALGPALAVSSAVSGYRSGGVLGAAKNLGGYAAGSFAWGMAAEAGAAVGGASTILPVAMLAGVGYGTYKALQFGNARIRKQRNLEMGSPIIDPFGTASTMRQRSLQALQNSQFNGRSAFGSEAALMHMPTMR